MSVIVCQIPRTIRLRFFKIFFWWQQERIFWSFIRTEWRESVEAYGWALGVSDFISKLEFWDENFVALRKIMDKKAYRRARQQLGL